MSYYTAAGEPPGEWAGKGAAALGLSGMVDPDIIERLYQENTGPGGELLVKRRQPKAAADRESAAVAAYLAAHPYASATELAEVRAAERGKDPHQVPYFDLTVSAVKSVSVLHASYRIAARQTRDRGDQDRAAALDARADEIEAALMDSAREAVAWLERHATYTRTGHHSARSGEWRDGAGLTASLFLHHLSRDGDPQLHVHVAIWNRVQRADGADDKWRTLDPAVEPRLGSRTGSLRPRPEPGSNSTSRAAVTTPRASSWPEGSTCGTPPRGSATAAAARPPCGTYPEVAAAMTLLVDKLY